MTYTELLGLAVGLAMILVASLGYKLLFKREAVESFDGWKLAFGGLGVLITLLGLHMTLTLPLPESEAYKSVLFGGPASMFGILLLMASSFLWQRGNMLADMMKGGQQKMQGAFDYVLQLSRPVSWIVFGLGLALAGIAAGAFENNIVGTPPPQEPLMGPAPGAVVNFYIATSLWVLPAIGALLTPLAVYTKNRTIMAIVGTAWFLGGIAILLLGAFVFYSHITMEFNFRLGREGWGF